MKFIIDHDLHVHTHLSPCSGDPTQTPERVIADAGAAGLKTVCITDHYWDELVSPGWDFYGGQTYERLSSLLPLPKKEEFELLFGCEADVSHDRVIGISPARYDAFDFISIPLTASSRRKPS
ncbi:MAG: PHP domain-containing protein [Clostridia bacterium]|nr:PHP domain-containing protein [Clostridia bacterium]